MDFHATIPQAEALRSDASESRTKVDRAVLFEIPDDDLVKQTFGRRTCVQVWSDVPC